MEDIVHCASATREHDHLSLHQPPILMFKDSHGRNGEESEPCEQLTRSFATRALAVTLVDWDQVGRDVWGPPMSPHDTGGRTHASQEARNVDLQMAVDSIAALFMVRLAAIWDVVTTSQTACEARSDDDSDSDGEESLMGPLAYSYSDFSTATVCQQTIQSRCSWPFLARHGGESCETHLHELERQVRQYITNILGRYDPDLPYHNYHHAYHVVLSVNKLLDLMLRQDNDETYLGASRATLPPLFGLRRDANLQLALLFAALVHDVDHRGVTNQQLVREANPLALQYNDTSVQENNSLTVAFQTLLKDEYTLLRACMFPAMGEESNHAESGLTAVDDDAFQRFRSLVINLVLSTDIASPERSQLGKAVFKEAFRSSTHRGTDQTAGEEQMRSSSKRRNSAASRRGSLTSEISMPRTSRSQNRFYPRRRSSHTSACSLGSGVTLESAVRMKKELGQPNEPGADPSSDLPPGRFPARYNRRGSASSDYDSVAFLHRRVTRPSRRLSNDPSVDSYLTEGGMDSIDMLRRGDKNANRPAAFIRQHHHHESFSASSIDVADSASILSSPSHSTQRLLRSQDSLPVVAPNFGLTTFADQNDNRHRRCRISRRWSTEMSGQSQEPVGNPSAKMRSPSIRVGATKQVSRLVHEYYGYGDCSGDKSSLGDSDDNSSLSLTPPSSEDEMDGVVITGLTLSSSSRHECVPVGGAIVIARKKRHEKSEEGVTGLARSAVRHPANVSRRASTGMSTYARAAGPLNGQVIDENREVHGTHKGSDDVLMGKDDWRHHRRYSLDNDDASKQHVSSHSKRLGIRRSMDLSGEPIERFCSSNHSRLRSQSNKTRNRRSSLGDMSTFSAEGGVFSNDCYHDYDEPDELKASAIADLMLRVADVGHFFQRYDTMVQGTSQTFRELVRAHRSRRGIDPRPSWFDNQVRIIEGYLLPLARQLEGTGVLSRGPTQPSHHGRCVEGLERRGSPVFSLVQNLEANHDLWMRQGFEVVASLIQEESATQ